MCVCVRACVRVCVRACVRAYERQFVMCQVCMAACLNTTDPMCLHVFSAMIPNRVNRAPINWARLT